MRISDWSSDVCSSDLPHLHFHVADAPAPLGAEGLPFEIDRFRVLGRYPDIGALGNAPWTPLDDAQPSRRVRERPASSVVVMFDSAVVSVDGCGSGPRSCEADAAIRNTRTLGPERKGAGAEKRGEEPANS